MSQPNEGVNPAKCPGHARRVRHIAALPLKLE
jgi:hypothetical protein